MGGFVERQFPRVACGAGVGGSGRFGRFYATARDVSLGGMCVETDYPLAVGEQAQLELRLPGPNDRPLSVSGRVEWIEQDAGLCCRVGLQFDRLALPALTAIKEFVAAGLPADYPPGAAAWPLLFSPFDLGPLRLKHRIVMAPMFWGYAHRDGSVSEPLLDTYREIAQGGAAMIVVANAIVAPEGSMSARALRIDDDRFIPGLARLAATLKEAGCVPCLQLNHAGRYAQVPSPATPSPVPLRIVGSELSFLERDPCGLGAGTRLSLIRSFCRGLANCRREMSAEEIAAAADSYAQAALRAKQAGYEAVELHGATGYLLAQFLSPRTNTRSDGYGGSLEGRMRFPLEVVARVKELVGPGFPVGYRFLAEEWLPGGFDLPQAKVFAKRLDELGVAYLSVVGATYESILLPEVFKRLQRPGCLVPLADQIKRVVSVPVITAGRINSPQLAEKVLEEDRADLIGLARGLFVDPQWPRKALEGRSKNIRQCRGCQQCFISVLRNEPAVCPRWDAQRRVRVRASVRGDRTCADVLIAIDGSDNSLSAVEYARRFLPGPSGCGQSITLFHVSPADGAGDGAVALVVKEVVAQARDMLASSGVPSANIHLKVVPEELGIAGDIIRELEDGPYGLAIIGRRGLSAGQRLLFGSVSSTVLRSIKDCAVCVVD